MARKCSHCGNYGHNSRTCGSSGHREATMLCQGGDIGGVRGGGGSSGLRLFGVQVHAAAGGGAGLAAMKKSYSMDCLQLAAPGGSLVSPSSSSSSSLLLSIEEGLESAAATNGYMSDGNARVVAERKKGVPWSEEEHRQFLAGLEKLGKGDWRGISRNYVTTRTPTQVASHAQKFFLRQSSMGKKKRRSSLFDMVPICENNSSISDPLSSERASTSLSLNVPPRHGRSERTTAAFDLNSTEEDDGRADLPSASVAGTSRPFQAAPRTELLQPSSHHGHQYCSRLDLELGMSLSTPSIGT
ncbi:unnamed protein product [Urochloa decumbens]|uniref:Uncharacterized protein n=1 Tax=Urochloa decumbens TaxID=240449 RepID=A0ABC8ZJT5_9POAL